jgi:DNA-binding NarL/FixJ family response regulator
MKIEIQLTALTPKGNIVIGKLPLFLDLEKPIFNVHSGGIELTARENQVMKLIVQGKCNKEIASTLELSERTVKFYASSLYQKYQVDGRGQLVHRLSLLGEAEADISK